MVLEISLARFLFLMARYAFCECAAMAFSILIVCLVEKVWTGAKICSAIALICLIIFLLLGLLSPCIH